MNSRPRFEAEYIRREFERIGVHLDRPLTLYLLGGGAMSLRDLKESTKDIDIVVPSNADYERLVAVLSQIGYEEVTDLAEEYRQLGATCCLENADGCRLDLFDRQVANKLVLSSGMKQRSDHFASTDVLAVNLVSLEDVFLFKAVAGRETDIGDMNVLVQSGLDFTAVEQEIRSQTELLENIRFVTYVTSSLDELDERHNVTLTLREELTDLVEQFYDAVEVWNVLDEPTSVETLRDELSISAEKLAGRLEILEEADRIRRNGDLVFPADRT